MKYLIVLAFFIMLMFCIAWFVWEFGRGKDRIEYIHSIGFLETFIESCDINNENFDYIMSEFDKLNGFMQRDTDRNKKLFVRFCFKFKDEWIKRI